MKVIRSFVYRIYLSHKQQESFERIYNQNVEFYNTLLDFKLNNVTPSLSLIIKSNKKLFHGNVNSYLNTYRIFNATCHKIKDLHEIKKKNIYYFPKKIHFKLFNDMVPTFENNRVSIPHIGNFRIKNHRPIPNNSRFLHFILVEQTCNNYYINFTIEYEISTYSKTPKKAIGLDYSSPNLFHTSENEIGSKYLIRNFMEDGISRIKKKLSRCSFNSRNYLKLRDKERRMFEKVRHKRNYFLHKAATDLINSYDIIGVETLSLQQIATHWNLGKHTYENAYNKFLCILKYKAKDHGKFVIYVPKFFPSTKMCSACGQIHYDMDLSDRMMVCDCGAIIDRDFNAAINIKNKALLEFQQKCLPRKKGG